MIKEELTTEQTSEVLVEDASVDTAVFFFQAEDGIRD